MTRATSVIDINGTTYNAATGDVISSVSKLAQSSSGVIDGFVRSSSVKKVAAKVAPRRSNLAIETKPKPSRQPRHSAKAIHHRTERSKTLVRSAVRRPSMHIKAAVRSLSRPPELTAPLDSKRASRAKAITKHAAVRRFGVPRPPESAAAQPAQTEVKTVSVRPRAHSVAMTSAAPAVASATSHQKLERMLDEALSAADAHKEELRARRYGGLAGKLMKWPKWLSFGLAILALAAIAAFLAWRYLPQVSVKLASQRAHVRGTLPEYTPSGFGFAKTAAQPGTLSVQYQDKTKAGSYTLVEKKTDMDSASVAGATIQKGTPVQTSQVGGTTVYIYGASNDATWVNDGTQYMIKNSANLGSDQLLKIVQSL